MDNDPAPSYLELTAAELKYRAAALRDLASPCRLCPRRCGSDRAGGDTGYCRTGMMPVVSSVHPHFGEEAPLVGSGGSGTIFFTNCNLGCVFCQNYDISHQGKGTPITTEALASAMLNLQHQGCHNINLVTPSHQVHAIMESLVLAIEQGLSLPIVYNTGGYDSPETLRNLDGIVDIYMPDLKFMDTATAAELADAADYPAVASEAIRIMHRQVGDLAIDGRGVAARGLLVRHLVLPADLASSRDAFRFLAEEISSNTYLNVMAQYRPCHEAVGRPAIGQPLSGQEYTAAVSTARELGLKRLD
jgi:putative pyruvate formate lyase activating enzyme